jgi:hypothetical protein
MVRFLVATSVLLALSTIARADDDDVARSFAFSVGTTAARVEPASGDKSYERIRCWQAGDTPVYFGGKDVTPREGYPICGSTPGAAPAAGRAAPACESHVIELETDHLYAVVAPNPGAPGSPASQSIACIAVQ